MTDPRNIAHDKKVRQEKKHRGQEVAPGAAQAVQPGRKPHIASTADTVAPEGHTPPATELLLTASQPKRISPMRVAAP